MKGKDLNFNSQEEEECVETIFSQAMECLKEEDRSLNFIETLLPLLKRGIGVHHSGLLPILKEVIELLFQEQLIKVKLQLFLLLQMVCFLLFLLQMVVFLLFLLQMFLLFLLQMLVFCVQAKQHAATQFAACPNKMPWLYLQEQHILNKQLLKRPRPFVTHAHVVILHRQLFASLCTFSEST